MRQTTIEPGSEPVSKHNRRMPVLTMRQRSRPLTRALRWLPLLDGSRSCGKARATREYQCDSLSKPLARRLSSGLDLTRREVAMV